MKAGRPGGPPGRVRIMGGTLRGSVLTVPDQPGLRPTPGRLRETLFNWLQPALAGARCLDLFAGTGALAIEALSRGAAHAVLIERDVHVAAALVGNLVRLKQDAHAIVHTGDALALLARAPAWPVDIAFVDPPFAQDLREAVAERLERSRWLAARAMIYVEMPVDAGFVPPAAWVEQRVARAGGVRGILYRRCDDPLS